MPTEEVHGCCSSGMTGPRPITTSSSSDEAGRGWPAGGCPRGSRGWRRCTSWSAESPRRRTAETRPGGGRDRDRPRAVGAGAGRGRLHGVRGQPAAGGPLPGTALRRPGRSPTRVTRTCWPSWCAWTAPTTARSPGTPTLAEHVKVLARSHQSMIWTRQRQANALRSMLREFYPAALAAFGDDLTGRDALAVLAIAPSPAEGPGACPGPRSRPRCAAAGRQRNLDAAAERIQAALRSPQLEQPPALADAYAAAVAALVAVIAELIPRSRCCESEVGARFGRHPDAEICLSQPGLGHDPGRPGARRVRRRPAPLRRREGPQELRRDEPDHPSLRHQTGRAGPLRPQPAPGRRALPAGLRRADRFTRSPRPTTTGNAPAAPPTTRPCAPWPTASSASCTAAYATDTRYDETIAWPPARRPEISRRLTS